MSNPEDDFDLVNDDVTGKLLDARARERAVSHKLPPPSIGNTDSESRDAR